MLKNFAKAALKPLPLIASLYRNLRDLIDQRAPSLETRWGFRLAGHPDMASGNFEPEETALVRKTLEDAEVFINIGANVGYYCCHALSLAKPVIAVEPMARNVHYLLRNIQENNWSEMAQVFPVALGSKSSILKIWGGGTGASLVKGWASIPEDYVTQVPVLTLDRVLSESINGKRSLILVDIEGAEFMMLQGAKQTLTLNPKPIWIVEIASTEHQPAGIDLNPDFKSSFDIFFDAGYKAFTANDSQEEITPDIVQAIVRGDRQMKTHNFIFR